MWTWQTYNYGMPATKYRHLGLGIKGSNVHSEWGPMAALTSRIPRLPDEKDE